MELSSEDDLVNRLIAVIRDYSQHGNISTSSDDQFDRCVLFLLLCGYFMANNDAVAAPPLFAGTILLSQYHNNSMRQYCIMFRTGTSHPLDLMLE